MMTQQMELSIQRQEVGEKVFRAIGESAPAFGMVGTLVGLVQMLSSMDDPTTIGRATAVALLTTLYVVLIAQLIALPISDKLEVKNEIERANRVLSSKPSCRFMNATTRPPSSNFWKPIIRKNNATGAPVMPNQAAKIGAAAVPTDPVATVPRTDGRRTNTKER